MPKKETWSKFKTTELRKLDWGTFYAPRPAKQSEAGRGAFYVSPHSDLLQVTTG